LTFPWGVDALGNVLGFPTQQLVFLLMRSITIVTALSIANSSVKKMFIKMNNTINFHTFS
jgi:hypothetical protein